MAKRVTAEERVMWEAICKYCTVTQINQITQAVLAARNKEKPNGV